LFENIKAKPDISLKMRPIKEETKAEKEEKKTKGTVR
jgi:hypothetical protein